MLQHYLSAKEEGKEPYFDADQIDEMLDSFEDSNDYTYFDEVLALGLKLHPGNSALQIKKGRQFAYNEDYESALTLLENIAETDNQDLDMLKMECYCSLNQYPKVLEITEELITRDCDYLEEVFEYISPILNDLDMNKDLYLCHLAQIHCKERDIWTAETLFHALEVCDDPRLRLCINLSFSCPCA